MKDKEGGKEEAEEAEEKEKQGERSLRKVLVGTGFLEKKSKRDRNAFSEADAEYKEKM